VLLHMDGIRLIRTYVYAYDLIARMLALARTTVLRLLCISAAIGAAGCATIEVRTNYTPPHGKAEPRTIQVLANSSIKHSPMKENSSLRDQVAAAFRQRFPNAGLVESKPDIVVFFTIVDYVPGCLPNCEKFRTYRNWTCEVEMFPRESEPETGTLVFNLDGSTYNPLYDPAANCAARFAKVIRQ
jgi:hypothetical protein